MKKVITMIILLFPAMLIYAEVERIVDVSYRTQYGYSDEYTMEVTFLTGFELNRNTRTFNYQAYKIYALIWFSSNEVAVLEFDDNFFGVGQEFDALDFRNAFQIFSEKTATQVNSQNRRIWRIQAKSFTRWIDPRVN